MIQYTTLHTFVIDDQGATSHHNQPDDVTKHLEDRCVAGTSVVVYDVSSVLPLSRTCAICVGQSVTVLVRNAIVVYLMVMIDRLIICFISRINMKYIRCTKMPIPNGRDKRMPPATYPLILFRKVHVHNLLYVFLGRSPIVGSKTFN